MTKRIGGFVEKLLYTIVAYIHINISPKIFLCQFAHSLWNLIVYIGRKFTADPVNWKSYKTFFSVYVENGRSQSATTLAFTIAATGGGSWRIKVSQIECSNLARATTDCHQFLTGVSGEFSSYNFPTQMLASTDFTFCVRREEGRLIKLNGVGFLVDKRVPEIGTFA